MKVLTISGYKSFELGVFKNDDQAVQYIKKAIEKSLLGFLEEGLEWVIISGQMGVELWAAEVVFNLQMEYSDLKLAILTPFLNQESKWNEINKEYYEFILSQADFVDSITKREYESPVQFRQKNEFLVSKSDGLLLLFDEEKEGSPKYLLETARKKQELTSYFIGFITFSDLQLVVEEENMKNADFW
ncbi:MULTISPECIES: DUF1273 domain-containing protein [Metabacillus]|uniref:UPF0398 protein A6K24_21435 n=2 Tax=Metabacillus TaxID=2675233 RepID=A0A179SWS8_9BACI|nr:MULTISPECIES: DUF1273 domain-containing protein [Metabacillus]OAS86286.1 hypothetical protein A6K24_21435 [Metabacillus litoralis]QNF30620.1 DUF1273 domain-containing protein [Metabacillus sp. KUDC1714]